MTRKKTNPFVALGFLSSSSAVVGKWRERSRGGGVQSVLEPAVRFLSGLEVRRLGPPVCSPIKGPRESGPRGMPSAGPYTLS